MFILLSFWFFVVLYNLIFQVIVIDVLLMTTCVYVCVYVCVCVCVCMHERLRPFKGEGFICLDQLGYQGTDQRCYIEDVNFLCQVPSSLL